MLIVGENLKALMEQHEIASKSNFDNDCISLSLDSIIIKMEPISDKCIIEYGKKVNPKYFKEIVLSSDYLEINPREVVLACSGEKIRMPNGYFGLIQTKGSLARLFVSVHFSDGQVDPGYQGKLTFEIFNASNFIIRIPVDAIVANLYIFKTSTNQDELYSGKYNNAIKPTCYNKL